MKATASLVSKDGMHIIHSLTLSVGYNEHLDSHRDMANTCTNTEIKGTARRII